MATISAIYENGVFRPVAPVDLPERTAVEIVVPVAPPEASPLPLATAPAADGILRSAGAWADFPEMDAVMDQIHQERRAAQRPEVAL